MHISSLLSVCFKLLSTYVLVAEVQTQGVNTILLAEPPSAEVTQSGRTLEQWSHVLGREEQEMDAMVDELLGAFPSQTSESKLGNGGCVYTYFAQCVCVCVCVCTVCSRPGGVCILVCGITRAIQYCTWE